MAQVKYDVSDFVTQAGDPARLVVSIAPPRGGVHAVTAEVDGADPLTGTFTWPSGRQGAEPVVKGVSDYGLGQSDEIGTDLFRALFSGALSRAWAQARDRARVRGGLHIVVRSIAPQVHALPWELLSDPTLTASEHLAVAQGWSVLRDVWTPAHEAARTPTLRDRLAVSSLAMPILGLDLHQDTTVLQAALGTRADVVEVVNASGDAVLGALSATANIVHIMANGRPLREHLQDLVLDGRSPDQIITLSGSELMAAALASADLDLVVFAGCDTDLLAAQLARVVPAVIGIRGIIANDSCEAFLQGLYRALSAGSTLSQAVRAGRAQQMGFSRSLGDDWAQPVLYLSGDGPLLSPPGSGGAGGRRRPGAAHHRRRSG